MDKHIDNLCPQILPGMSHYWCMGCSGRHSEIQTMWLEKTAHVLSTTKCSSIEVNKKMEISSGTSTRWPFVHCFRIELEFGKCWFFVEGRKQENSGKTLGARNRTNNKLAPQGPRVGTRNWATLMIGKRSNLCVTPAVGAFTWLVASD